VSEILDKITDAVASGNYGTVDDLWLELLNVDPIPADDLAGLITQLVAAGQGTRAIDLVLAIAPELIKAERHAEANPLLQAIAPAAEGNEDVRAYLIDCYRGLHADKIHLSACIDRSGILTEADLATAAATLERFLARKKGDYFYHPSGWGVGQVVSFDPLSATAQIDFENKPGHNVPLDSIETIFIPLEPDDFRVLRKIDPDALRQLAKDDPAALVRKVLVAHDGRITQRRLRDELHGTTVPKADWSKWWTRARAQLRRDPHVEIGKGSNPVLTLRDEALTYEDEMRERFIRLRDLHLRTELLRDYKRHMAKDADPETFLHPTANAIALELNENPPPADAFEAAMLLAELALDTAEFPSTNDILTAQPDPIRLLRGLSTDPARKLAMDILQQTTDNWPKTCRDVLMTGPAELWDAALAGLPETGEPPTKRSLVGELCDNPRQNINLFSWIARAILREQIPTDITTCTIFELLLAEGNDLARRKAEHRPSEGVFKDTEKLANVRTAIRTGDLDYFDPIIAQASETEATRLLFRIRQSTVLTEMIAYQLERKIMRRYPRLMADEAREAESTEPQIIYSTPKAIDRRRAEHEHLVNEEIPANEKRIAAAAAMGDISDNADWRAAIEEQGNLSRRARDMADELQRARPIEPNMVHTDHVSIGSRVTVENTETTQQTTYDILGPWDADPDRHIMSYTAPLARVLMTEPVGTEVILEHAGERATYRILTIESTLAPTQDNG